MHNLNCLAHYLSRCLLLQVLATALHCVDGTHCLYKIWKGCPKQLVNISPLQSVPSLLMIRDSRASMEDGKQVSNESSGQLTLYTLKLADFWFCRFVRTVNIQTTKIMSLIIFIIKLYLKSSKNVCLSSQDMILPKYILLQYRTKNLVS